MGREEGETRLRQLKFQEEETKKLTTRTNPGPAVERQIRPSHPLFEFRPLPARGHELGCVVAVQVAPAVHGVHAVAHRLALAHEDRGSPVGPAAARERGRLESAAGVDGDGGEEAE